MKNKTFCITAMTAVLGISATHGVVTISAVGDGTGYEITGSEVAGFRSTGVTKTFDVSGDDAYGTSGYMVFGGAASSGNGQPIGGTSDVSSNPSFVTSIAGGSDFISISRSTAYANFDNPSLAISTSVADFGASAIAIGVGGSAGAWSELLTFTIDASAPASFRLGILAGNEANENGRWDPTGLRVSFEGGSATTIAGLANLTGETGMVFFDIAVTDGSTGVFSIEAQQRLNSQGSSLAGITFDVVIPEPSSFALLSGCLALGSVLLRRRRG